VGEWARHGKAQAPPSRLPGAYPPDSHQFFQHKIVTRRQARGCLQRILKSDPGSKEPLICKCVLLVLDMPNIRNPFW